MADDPEKCMEFVLKIIQCDETTSNLIKKMTCVNVQRRLTAKEALVKVMQQSQDGWPKRKRTFPSNTDASDMLEELNAVSTSKIKEKGPSADLLKLTAAADIHMSQALTIQLKSVEESNEDNKAVDNKTNIDPEVGKLPCFDLLLSSDLSE